MDVLAIVIDYCGDDFLDEENSVALSACIIGNLFRWKIKTKTQTRMLISIEIN